MLESNPHKLRSAELLQVALLVFQSGHLVLYLNDFVKVGDSKGIAAFLKQLDELCVVEAELDIKDFFLIIRKLFALHRKDLLSNSSHQLSFQKVDR